MSVALKATDAAKSSLTSMIGSSDRCSNCQRLVRFKLAANPAYQVARRLGAITDEPKYLKNYEPHAGCTPPATWRERLARCVDIFLGR